MCGAIEMEFALDNLESAWRAILGPKFASDAACMTPPPIIFCI
jgi:hypothetical protein